MFSCTDLLLFLFVYLFELCNNTEISISNIFKILDILISVLLHILTLLKNNVTFIFNKNKKEDMLFRERYISYKKEDMLFRERYISYNKQDIGLDKIIYENYHSESFNLKNFKKNLQKEIFLYKKISDIWTDSLKKNINLNMLKYYKKLYIKILKKKTFSKYKKKVKKYVKTLPKKKKEQFALNIRKHIFPKLGSKCKGFFLFFKKQRRKFKKRKLYLKQTFWGTNRVRKIFSKKRLMQNSHTILGISKIYKKKENRAVCVKNIFLMKKHFILKYNLRTDSIYFNVKPFIKKLLNLRKYIKSHRKKLVLRFSRKKSAPNPHFHYTRKFKKFRVSFLAENRIKHKNKLNRFHWKMHIKHGCIKNYIKKYIDFLKNRFFNIKIFFYALNNTFLCKIISLKNKCKKKSLFCFLKIRLFFFILFHKLKILTIYKFLRYRMSKLFSRKIGKRVIKTRIRLYFKNRNKRIFFTTYFTWFSGILTIPFFWSVKNYTKLSTFYIYVFYIPYLMVMFLGVILWKISFPFPFLGAIISTCIFSFFYLSRVIY